MTLQCPLLIWMQPVKVLFVTEGHIWSLSKLIFFLIIPRAAVHMCQLYGLYVEMKNIHSYSHIHVLHCKHI